MHDAGDIDQWLALWEPRLVGEDKDLAAAHVKAAGLIPRLTYYDAENMGKDINVITLLVGHGNHVKTVRRGGPH